MDADQMRAEIKRLREYSVTARVFPWLFDLAERGLKLAAVEAENSLLKAIVQARTHRENGCICEDCVADEYETARVVEELRQTIAAQSAEIEKLKRDASYANFD